MTTITLTSGNDTYTSTTPGDAIFGLEGNDKITASNGGNSLFGGDGNDVLNGGAGDDYIVGDNNTNTTYHNILRGFGGDDYITSYSWYDKIAGGAGNDKVTVFALTTGQLVDGGSGSDTLILEALLNQTVPVNIVMASTFIPVVGGINGATYTNFETLIYYGGTGANTIQGGAGNDQISINIAGASGFDAGFLKGMGGDDRLEFHGLTNAGTGIEAIDGGTGNDTLVWMGRMGGVTINATLGTMTEGGAVFATFTAVENLNIEGTGGDTGTFTFTGGAGIDTLSVFATNSIIHGNAGNDNIVIYGGSSVIDGGGGDDFVNIVFDNDSAQTIHGGAGNDSLHGGSGQSQIYGDGGNDNLSANNGRTSEFGGGGDDTLYLTSSYSTLGVGSATLDGGSGRDVLSLDLSHFGSAFTADFSKATTLADGTTIVHCEAITFFSGGGDDVLKSSNDLAGLTANFLFGNNGNDTLTAAANGATLDAGFGDDTLIGGAGADKLIGSYGIDSLNGKAGADSLNGGSGKDTLTGGQGADTFIFSYYAETGNDALTRDVITDFKHAELDKIDLSLLDADGVTSGNQAFTFIHTAAFGSHAGELRYEKFNNAGTANDYTLVSGDIDGNGVSDFQIELKGLVTLAGTDFVL